MDYGGVARECWRLFMQSVEEHYFIGNLEKKVLDRNVPAIGVRLIFLVNIV